MSSPNIDRYSHILSLLRYAGNFKKKTTAKDFITLQAYRYITL